MYKSIGNLCLLCFFVMAMTACKSSNSSNANTNVSDTTETYFSTKFFLENQWSILKEQPLVLLKTVKENDKIDSFYVPLDSTLFAEISAPFLKADISAIENIGKYNFSFSEDRSTDLLFLHYDATDEKAFCTKLMISANAENQRIFSIYAETHESSFLNSTTQKLNYTTTGAIIIQEFSKSLFMSPDEKVISYFQKY